MTHSCAAGFVNVDSEKMSKSLGNFFTIRDVVARYHPGALCPLRCVMLCCNIMLCRTVLLQSLCKTQTEPDP